MAGSGWRCAGQLPLPLFRYPDRAYVAQIGRADDENERDDARRRHAPDADRVNYAELQVRQPAGEEHPERRLADENDGDDRLVLEALESPDYSQREHVEVEQKSPRGDRQAKESRPFAGVDRLA